jgi:WD40 repeat protein
MARKKTGSRALNALRWSLDGRRIATGDADGYVSLWGVDKDFCVQKNDDFNKLERLITQNQFSNS